MKKYTLKIVVDDNEVATVSQKKENMGWVEIIGRIHLALVQIEREVYCPKDSSHE